MSQTLYLTQAYNSFITGCKSDGIWDAIKTACVMAGWDGLAGGLTPLKGVAPTNNNFVAADYNRKTGLKGDRSTKYLNTNRAHNADAQDDGHVSVYASEAMTDTARSYIGASDAAQCYSAMVRYYQTGYDGVLSYFRTGVDAKIASRDATGFLGMSRSAAASYSGRGGGASASVQNASVSGQGSNPYSVYASNNGGNSSNPSDARISFYSIGTNLNLALLDARVTRLMDDIGYIIDTGMRPLGNLSTNSLYDTALLMSASTATSPKSGGTLTVNGASLGNYDFAVRNGETLSSFTSSDWFTQTQDTSSAWCVVKGDLTINSGVTFTPPVRKLFTVLVVTGNLTVNGTISMTARGANHSGSGNSVGATAATAIRIINGTYSGVTNPEVPAAGGALKDDGRSGALSNASGLTGNAGASGGTGGGGTGGYTTGGARGYTASGSGGTSFSGGSGSGGFTSAASCSGSATTSAQSSGKSDGGAGGTASSNTTFGAGGGAGNPGGLTTTCGGSSGSGSDGTGGVLIIIVLGTLSGTGSIVSSGSAGGNSQTGGGGSGGGSVTVLSKTDTSSITPQANGGSGGTGTFGAGGSGGAGTARKLAL